MHNQRIRYLLVMGAGGLISLLSLARITHAETIIDDGYLSHNTIWTQNASPYIVEDPVTIPSGVSLTVEPGVSIIASSSIEGYNLFNVDGGLNLNGEKDQHISISGVSGISISSGHLEMKETDLLLPLGLGIYNASANISSSTISGAKIGVDIRSSKVNIFSSQIIDNNQGIVVQDSGSGGIFQVRNNDLSDGLGGIGNAFLAQSATEPSVVKIINSAIVNNKEQAIYNNDNSLVRATNNWWGNKAGPTLFGTNRIAGLISYIPWLEKDPFIIEPKSDCCSSILFLPGLEGTRLFKDEKFSILGTMTNQLWEPNRNADVKKLYLDNFGSSTDKSIYSGEPVSSVFGLWDVYGKFLDFLEAKKENKIINEWKAFGYDWRKPINEVVAGKENKATTTESLVDVVNDLAKNSKTGKVTIVAHSNGGLVAKYLVKVLNDLGKVDLVDSVISVAVPYLGTPQAIAGLLHGYGQSIAGGIILNKSTARNLGINMSSTYSLLPSREYFSKIFGPTIAFASTTVIGVNNGSYPQNISTYQDQTDFIVDSENNRINPPTADTQLPIKGNKGLLLAGDIIHSILDPFTWPATISRWSILGWGIDTVKNVIYSTKTNCKKTPCEEVPVFKTEKTIMGDGTVVAPSATYNSGTAVSLDLNNISKQEKREVAHVNILGASTTLNTIDDITSHNPADDNKELIDKISKIPGVTIGEPDYSKERVSLVLSTHSPVELHVYDSQGNHTGPISKPKELEDVEDGLYTFYDQNILGSSFETNPDGFGGDDSYVYLPDNDGMNYTVVIKGNGFGEFTYKIDRVRGGDEIDTVEYANIPVTPFTIATTTIQARASDNSPIPVLASSSPVIKVDLDGNGLVDIVATSSTTIDPIEYHKSLRSILSSLIGNTKRFKDIIKRVDKLDELLRKGKLKQVRDLSEKLEKKFGHKKFNKLSTEEREEIIDVIENYIKQYE